MSKPKYFAIAELADPKIISRIGEEETWELLDPKLFPAIDWLREIFGPLLINGKGYSESGLRDPNTATGSPKSAHKKGQAYDIKPLTKGVTVQKMYSYVLANKEEALKHGITEVEDIRDTTTTNPYGGWFHISCRPHSIPNTIRVIRP